MSGLIITSSGTGVGKTFVTCALLAHDQQAASIFSASKPIISGFPENINEIGGSDTALLLSTQRLPCTPAAIDDISPWRFKAPLSPDLAGKLEGKIINSADLIHFSRQKLLWAEKNGKHHLIEGVGGVMCPLASGFTMLDWMVAMDAACVVVVGTYLGALSHTLTAIEVLKNRGIPIAAIVINETVESTVTLAQTRESLREFLKILPLFSLPNTQQSSSDVIFKEEMGRLYTRVIEECKKKKGGNNIKKINNNT